jgi:P27 family predicted phage terminase small subunit
MSGRNKQPLTVIEGKGKSNHLTKEEKKKRLEHEDKMRGFTDNVSPPDYLTASQKREFEKLAKELIRLEIFSNLDVDSLARYIDSRDQYISLVKKIRSFTAKDDFKLYAQMQRTKNLLFNECRSAASDLGLTISARLKLVLPEKENTKPTSKWEKFK